MDVPPSHCRPVFTKGLRIWERSEVDAKTKEGDVDGLEAAVLCSAVLKEGRIRVINAWLSNYLEVRYGACGE